MTLLFRFFFFFLFSFKLYALFDEEENLQLYHHVNVISGNLSLGFQDMSISGPVPFSLQRSYTSAGALERDDHDSDLAIRDLYGDFLIQGGWQFCPHIYLIKRTAGNKKDYAFLLNDKTGTGISYKFVTEKDKNWIFSPKAPKSSYVAPLNAQSNPYLSTLSYNPKKSEVEIHFPDGSHRSYRFSKHGRCKSGACIFTLAEEVMPSGHHLIYHYNNKNYLKCIELKNPQGTKTFASVHMDVVKEGSDHHPFHFQLNSSSGQTLHYRSQVFKSRQYINKVEGNCHHAQDYEYVKARKGAGARVKKLFLDGREQFLVDYYEPPSKSSGRKWAEHPKKVPLHIDKVRALQSPIGPHGEHQTVAEFDYTKHYTDVRGADHVKVRYHHNGKKLAWIEYFDEQDRVHSSLKLFYVGDRLTAKVRLDADYQPLFSKVFDYDAVGNVIKETLYGQFTKQNLSMQLKEDGRLEGAEELTRTYLYDPHTHHMLEETQEEGLTFRYAYKPGTNLLSAKWTLASDRIIARQFFTYDEDHLLTCEISDDGSGLSYSELTDVTQRSLKRYTIDPASGMPRMLQQTYLDGGIEKQLGRTEFVYSPQNRITEEKYYDADDNYCYTLYTDYDSQGRVIAKTTPSSYKNTYTYGAQSELIAMKEEGSLAKEYTYSPFGLPLTCKQIDERGDTQQEKWSYDSKGRLLSHTDLRGNSTTHTYDAFGQCTQMQYPPLQTTKIPQAFFRYDILGNLISTSSSRGDTTQTTYNTLAKPFTITHSDGSTTEHFYDKRGRVIQTTYADNTTAHYTYDAQGRTTLKEVFSPSKEPLSSEQWVYNAHHILSYTDPQGLTTTYNYDAAGRLISENVEGRLTTYTYDSLGLLEKTTKASLSHIDKHDKTGQVIQSFDEDSEGRIENFMQFTYDKEGKKVQALRTTSKGDVLDTFAYDPKGRLCQHTDPLGDTTQWIYTEVLNDLNQLVLQKTIIDPIHNHTVETYDALGHLASLEKQDPSGAPVSRETYTYDLAGNRTHRSSLLYQGTQLIQEQITQWEYDSSGRVIKQIELPDRITQYSYDSRGFLLCKTLPSGVKLCFQYDGIGRLLELKSSDETIFYRYHYAKGSQPTSIDDRLTNTTLTRQYTIWGELTSETNPQGLTTSYSYDDQGRRTQLTLPDGSKIAYTYSGRHLSSLTRNNYTHNYLDFDPNGHVAKESLIHSLGQIITDHDELERPTSQNSPWLTQTLSYGPSGLILSQTNTLLGDKTFGYDPLSQLTQENDTTYAFDSLGNPLDATIDSYNQILSRDTTQCTYDPTGNPLLKTTPTQETHYTYDALSRLTHISTPTEEIHFTYDPLSRLTSKTVNSTTTLYLHDHQTEIGTCTPTHQILDLKVLGLGIQGDVGAAIAIEVDQTVLAPLHDFSGHIIALISPDGSLYETNSLDAFGKSLLGRTSSNPWCFSSKRQEGNLIYFPHRFYDLELGRWLTPDPAGFVDSPNLYLYVLNNPLNRLDLFGLFALSPEESERNFTLRMQASQIYEQGANTERLITGRLVTKGGIETDFFLQGSSWNELRFSEEELNANRVDLCDHFLELVSSGVPGIQLVTLTNGINTSFDEFKKMGDAVRANVMDAKWVLGVHNSTEGLLGDLGRAAGEAFGIETKSVQMTRQFLANVVSILSGIDPKSIILHGSHSEGGIITGNAINGMTPDEKALMKNHLLSLSLAPLIPVSQEYTVDAINVYSKLDNITGLFGRSYLKNSKYDVRFVDPVREGHLSQWGPMADANEGVDPDVCNYYRGMELVERSFYEHGFLNDTCQTHLREQIDDIRTKHGFFNGQTR